MKAIILPKNLISEKQLISSWRSLKGSLSRSMHGWVRGKHLNLITKSWKDNGEGECLTNTSYKRGVSSSIEPTHQIFELLKINACSLSRNFSNFTTKGVGPTLRLRISYDRSYVGSKFWVKRVGLTLRLRMSYDRSYVGSKFWV